MEFVNKSDKKFTDISSEIFREYEFDSKTIRIDQPQYLSVSDNGHRLFDGEGQSHYIPLGWLRLTWKAKAGSPHFVL